MSIVCLSNLFFANKFLKRIAFNGRCQNTLSLLLRRRHSPTSLSTSNHLHQWVLRGEVLRRIFRVTLADSHNDRVFCPLFIESYTLHNMLSNNSYDSNHWSTPHLADMMERAKWSSVDWCSVTLEKMLCKHRRLNEKRK